MKGDNASNRFGSSRFAIEAELETAGLYEMHPHSIFMGFFNGRAVYFHGPAGATITAGPRAGKMRDCLAFSLLSTTCLHTLIMLVVRSARRLLKLSGLPPPPWNANPRL